MTSINNPSQLIANAAKTIQALTRSVRETSEEVHSAQLNNILGTEKSMKDSLNQVNVTGAMTLTPRYQRLATEHMNIAQLRLNQLESGEITNPSRRNLLKDQANTHLEKAHNALARSIEYKDIMKEPVIDKQTQVSLEARRKEQYQELINLTESLERIDVNG